MSTIQIGEHQFKLPPLPDKKEILFSDEKKTHQYWRRQTDFPDFFYDWHEAVELEADKAERNHSTKELISLNRKDTETLIYLRDREIQRRKDGVWFMNNGEPTYLTGGHYFNLQWGAMRGCTNHVEIGSNYGQYYQFQRDVAYFMEICRTTPYGNGGLLVKSKKTGITQFVANYLLNESMLNRQKNYRFMSVTQDEAKDNNFNMISFAIEKLPNIIRPSHTIINLSEVFWGAPYGEIKKKSKNRKLDIEYLNTRLTTVPTKRAAFNGMTNAIAWIDEFPKIKVSTYPAELFRATYPTVMDSRTKVGFVFATSYVPEENDTSFKEAREVYYNSKLTTINPKTGQTKSGYICHIITAQEGLRDGCDKYGIPIPEKIIQSINDDIAAAKDDQREVQAKKRQFPMNENDAWLESAGEGTYYDNVRLGMKKAKLLIDEAHTVFPYVSGNLHFTQEPIFDERKKEWNFTIPNTFNQQKEPVKVLFVPDTKKDLEVGKQGVFKIYHPEWLPTDLFNQVVYDKKTKRIRPSSKTPFVAAMDSTSYVGAKMVVTASLNALQIFIYPDINLDHRFGNSGLKTVTHRLVAEYLYRRDRASDTVLDVIKAIIYFGCPILIEGNQAWVTTKLIEEYGLGDFVIMRNAEGLFEPYVEGKHQKLYSSQGNTKKSTIDDYVIATKEYLAKPDYEDEFDFIELLDSVNIIDDLMNFDTKNTRPFDAGVCFQIGIMLIEAYLGYRERMADLERLNEERSLGHAVSVFLTG